VSIRDGTVFEGSHLSVGMVLRIIILFITAYGQLTNQCVDEHETELSSETVNDWLTYLLEVQLEALVRSTQSKIGGPNCTVEVDESKFGKRKYNRGRVVEAQWVVGGIYRETGEIFVALCPDNKRDSATLISIVEQHVDERSTVITDCWKGYCQLEQDNWSHLTVNHSMNFVDPTTGTHTQNIENMWWQMKRNLSSTHGANMLLHFAQYLWRRKFDGVNSLLCTTFLHHISDIYPGRK